MANETANKAAQPARWQGLSVWMVGALLLSAVGMVQAKLSVNLIPSGLNTKSVIFEGFVLNTVSYDPDTLKLTLQSDLGNLDCGPEDIPPPNQVYIELDGRVYNIDASNETPIQLDPDATGGPALTIDVAAPDFSCAPSLNTSLTLSVDGQDELPVGAAVTHDVDLVPENNVLSLVVNDPLLCAQVGDSGNQMLISITDPNGSSSSYRGLIDIKFDTNTLDFDMTTDDSLQCFAFPGGGIPRSVQGGAGEIIFNDDFEVRDVDLNIQVTTQSSAIVGQGFDYQVVVSNAGPRDASNVSINEFYPSNPSNFPATLGAGSWNCSASAGANCGSGNSGVGAVILSGANIPEGGSLTFNVTRTVLNGSAGTLQIFAAVYPEMGIPDPNLGNNVSQLTTQTTTNDPPDVDLNGPAAGINYSPLFVPGGAVNVADAQRATITDSNDANLEGMTLRLISAPDGAFERLDLAPQFCPPDARTTCGWNAQTGEFTIVGTGTIGSYQTALRSVTYNNFATSPDLGDREVQVSVTDGSSTSPLAVTTIRIQDDNSAPVVDLNGDDNGIDNTINFQQGGAAINIANSNAFINDDSVLLLGMTVSISDIQDGIEEFVTADTSGTLIASEYNSNTGLLTLFGTDSIANYQDVLRSVRYRNVAAVPTGGSRAIQVIATDGVQLSQVATTTVTFAVNERPIIDLNGDQLPGIDFSNTFVATGSGVSVGDNELLSIFDDADSITMAEVRITNPQDGGAEVLDATGFCLSEFYNTSTFTLTLSGDADASLYEGCLRSVVYLNTDPMPTSSNRIIEVRVFDGELWSNPVAISTMTVQ